MKKIKIYMTLFILIFAFGCQNNNELTDYDITTDKLDEISTELQNTLVESTENMITELPTTIENVTETETIEDLTEEINKYTILEVWEIDDNESIKTQGIVTKVLTDKLLFIEDHSAVISIFGDIKNIKVGDLIEIDGVKTSHNGLHQISLSSFNIVSSNHSLTDSIDFDLEWDELILKSYQGQRFNIQSLLIHSIEQDTYGNLTFVLEDINTNVLYNGRYDSRLANVHEMTEHLLSLEDQIIYLEDVLLSYDGQPLFMFTNVDEISLTE